MGEIPEAPPVADEARELSEKTTSNDAAPRRQRDYIFEEQCGVFLSAVIFFCQLSSSHSIRFTDLIPS